MSRATSVSIETDRLRLRPLAIGDLDAFVELHRDPRVTRYITAYATRGAAEARLREIESEWRERGHGIFAVRERESGEVLGRAGLKYWPQFDETEVGWVFRADAWGRGYAGEAARACIDWGFANLDAPYLTAMIHPDNEASLRLARRLGMQPLRSDVLEGEPVEIQWLPRPDG
jgi:RimJ/RimL family protein N-acetyltransferase